jgi:hypothetical protein
MTTQFRKVKSFAGIAVMATAVTAVGFGLGSGTAQAAPKAPRPHPHTTVTQNTVTQNNFLHNFIQTTDNFGDVFQGVFGVGEDTPFDNAIDQFHHLM